GFVIPSLSRSLLLLTARFWAWAWVEWEREIPPLRLRAPVGMTRRARAPVGMTGRARHRVRQVRARVRGHWSRRGLRTPRARACARARDCYGKRPGCRDRQGCQG